MAHQVGSLGMNPRRRGRTDQAPGFGEESRRLLESDPAESENSRSAADLAGPANGKGLTSKEFRQRQRRRQREEDEKDEFAGEFAADQETATPACLLTT